MDLLLGMLLGSCMSNLWIYKTGVIYSLIYNSFILH